MHGSNARRFAAILVLGGLLIALPATALATVTGGCTATGTSSSSPDIDLTTVTTWHLKSTDTAGGHGTAPSPMKSASVAAYALGIPIPVISGSGNGDTAGSATGIAVSTYALLGHRFAVHGTASGDGGAACTGDFEVILDDVNPLMTFLGGGGLALFLVGLLVVLLAARSGGGMLARLLAFVFGGLGGAGLGLALEQFGVLDSRQFIGLALLIGGAVIGFAVTGRFGNRGPAQA